MALKPPVLLLNLCFLSLLSSSLIESHLSPCPATPPAREHHATLEHSLSVSLSLSSAEDKSGCRGLAELDDNASKCAYVVAHAPCVTQGYVDYLRLFYCAFGPRPALAYALAALWLLALFYLLGDTASSYFCASLGGLSRALRLPPALAGITLLSLGNGAPDVFSSLVSFADRHAAGEVGLSGVLGGALFVTSVVVGVVSVAGPGSGPVAIDRSAFVRDVFFLILVLAFVLAISVAGRVNLWASLCFFSLYVVYVLLVWAGGCCPRAAARHVPLLDGIEVQDPGVVHRASSSTEEEEDAASNSPSYRRYLHCFLRALEMPLSLPRRLTIPDASEERWSRPAAVASATLSPILLAFLWNSRGNNGDMGSEEGLTVLLSGALVGILLGIAALETTEESGPPRRCLFPWLAAGFLMSVIWVCLVATELVSLLASFGRILGISPVILGLTVLAWGNSLGDLMANVAMALRGGKHGVQTAISGCYAGPIFNTLVGLGLSLVLASWAQYPNPFEIPQDPSLFETLGFLIVGLVWALVVLPWRGMKLDRVLGVGLLLIYFSFLCLRLSKSLGLLQRLEIMPCLHRFKGFFYFWAIKPFDALKSS